MSSTYVLPTSGKYHVQIIREYGVVVISGDAFMSMQCLACGRTRREVIVSDSPHAIHYPEPAYCTCYQPAVDVPACLETLATLRRHLLSVNAYLNNVRPVTSESEIARDAVMATWEDLTRLSTQLGGTE